MAKSREFVSPRKSRNDQPTQKSFSQTPSSERSGNLSDQGHIVMSRFVCLAVAAAVTTLSLGFSGCCHTGCGGGGAGWGIIDNFMERQVGCMRDRVWAKRAFHLRYGHCERVHADHFRDGFIAGYGNVCDGHGGECPALPPEKYWSYRYRSQEGSEMQTAWFAGFEAGAGSAKSDGTTTFQEIQISKDLEEAMLAAEQLDDLHGGIEREYIIDMAPVSQGSGQMQGASMSQSAPPMMNSMSTPQTNMPYIAPGGSYGTTPVSPMINTPTGNAPMSNAPLAQPMIVPGSQAGYGSNQPLPVQIVPAEVPIVPGQSRR